MQCALVFYFVVTIFVVVYSLPEPCEVRDYFEGERAYCGRDDVKHTLDFIPPISQNISYIDLHRQPLKQLPYNAFRNLSSQSSISAIWLRHCQISHVDAGALLNLHKLITIDLLYNQINQIDSKLFSDTKQIEYINMGYNMIEVLPNGLFQNLTLLKLVYLHNNRIRQVEGFSFANTPSLKLIDLSFNQMESMNMSFKDEFDNLATLRLTDNLWECNCELEPIYEFLIKSNRLNHYEFLCEKPPTLQGRYWNDISRDEIMCRPEHAMKTRDSALANIKPPRTKEQDDTLPVNVYRGTRYQPVDTGIPQPSWNQNWILYTISGLALVCVAAVIIGVVLFKRRSDRRTNSRNMNSGLPMLVVQSSAVSENNDSG